MAATFTQAVRYEITAACLTPLRTGGGDRDLETVLRDPCGNAFLQGSSLAGAMREQVERTAGKNLAEKLFGSQERAGHLIVSDAMFSPEAEQAIRPRLRIDPKTGAADDKGKFDVAHICAGAELHFTVTWMGHRENSEEIEEVERALGAIHSGVVRLGAQKSNGFGKLCLQVKKQTYDLYDPDDRAAWLSGTGTGKPITLPAVRPENEVEFRLTGTVDAVLVKGGASDHSEAHSYSKNLEENGRTILPGSAIKGVLRARASLIAQSLGVSDGLTEALFGRGARDGDNGRPGTVRVEEVLLEAPQKQKIHRIRIDRFTGGVMRKALFSEEPVCSPITLRVFAPADRPEGCALLLYVLRDMGLGWCGLGSGGAIGRGIVSGETLEIISGDGKHARLTFGPEKTIQLSDPDALVAAWLKAWKECTV